ncbi:MAG: DUF4097 domain-containing protein [Kangiellaceae bacterium]|nr:DUF4097 domain-containing protein [Kangiellaceae bacterium]
MKTIKTTTALVLTVVMGLSVHVVAGEKINKSLDVSANGQVKIHNNRGDISVKGWDKNQIVVKGELDDLAEKFIFETKNNRTLIKVVLPRRNSHARSGGGSDLKIFVPKGYSVQFGGVSTDIDVSSVSKDVDISSVSGNIKLTSIGAGADINSVSGDISIKQVAGRLSISTVSGDVDAKVTSENIQVSGVSSDIKVMTNQIKSAKIETVSGDTFLHGKLNDSGAIRLSNVSGKSIYFTDNDLNARVILDTGPGGDIVNRLTKHEPTRSFIGSENLKFTVGDGEAQIRMSTVSGEIGLRSRK